MNKEELKIAKAKEKFRNDEEFRNKVIEYWVILIGQETERLQKEKEIDKL